MKKRSIWIRHLTSLTLFVFQCSFVWSSWFLIGDLTFWFADVFSEALFASLVGDEEVFMMSKLCSWSISMESNLLSCLFLTRLVKLDEIKFCLDVNNFWRFSVSFWLKFIMYQCLLEEPSWYLEKQKHNY